MMQANYREKYTIYNRPWLIGFLFYHVRYVGSLYLWSLVLEEDIMGFDVARKDDTP